MKKILTFALLLVGAAVLRAQEPVKEIHDEDSDIRGRVAAEVDWKAFKGFHVYASEELRLDENFSHVDRLHGTAGFCGETAEIRAARAALHFWEEPCISGKTGSGAVFFSGCSLKCIYCQNRSIAIGDKGKVVSVSQLADTFLRLQEMGACNINLVLTNGM